VETHSEHLIQMLRLRIAQDKDGSLREKVRILFVRGDREFHESNGGDARREPVGSYVENLQVDEYGSIINWPSDFFPEYGELNEKILKAMMTKHLGENR